MSNPFRSPIFLFVILIPLFIWTAYGVHETKMLNARKAYEAGHKAAENDLSEFSNPYRELWLRQIWFDGYIEGKRNENH